MQCLNIKNKEVAALLEEYTKILGSEDAAYYVLSENNGYGLDKAPNGAESKLFKSLFELNNGDYAKAIESKSKVYSDEFRNWFGDWIGEDKTNVSKVVDANGEPLITWHHSLANFDTFDLLKSDDKISIFASDSKFVAESYSTDQVKKQKGFIAIDGKIRPLFTRKEYDKLPQNVIDDYIERGIEPYIDERKPEYKTETQSITRNRNEEWVFDKDLEDYIAEGYKITDDQKNDYESGKNITIGKEVIVEVRPLIKDTLTTYPLYMNIKNPLVSSENRGKNWNNISFNGEKHTTRTLILKAKNEGKDGAMFNDIIDLGSATEETIDKTSTISNIFAVTDPNQVKSVNNSGKFSKGNDNIYLNESTTTVGKQNNNIDILFKGAEEDQPVDLHSVLTTIKESEVLDPNSLESKLLDVLLKRGVDTDGKIHYITDLGSRFGEPAKEEIDGSKTFVAGAYLISKDEIYMDKGYTNSNSMYEVAKVILHEVVHRYTVHVIKNPVTAFEREFHNNVKGLYNNLLKVAKENDKYADLLNMYGLTSEFELISEFLSKPEFRNRSKEVVIEYNRDGARKSYNLFDKIIKYLFDLLGIKSKKYSNFNEEIDAAYNGLYDEFLQFIENYSRYGSYEDTYGEPMFKKVYTDTSKIDESKLTGVKRIDDVYKTLSSRIEARIKDLKHFKTLDTYKIDHLSNLLAELDRLDAQGQIVRIIPEMAVDINRAHERVMELSNRIKTRTSNGDLKTLNAESLLQLRDSFIGFYEPIISDIRAILNDPSSLNYLKEHGVHENNIDTYLEDMRKVMSNFIDIKEEYSDMVRTYTENMLLEYAKDNGSTKIEELKEAIDRAGSDMFTISSWVFSPVHVRDEMLGILTNKILNGKNKVERETLAKGKELVASAKDVKQSEIELLYELDKNGIPTGYMIRDLNYGQMIQDYTQFKREMSEKYKLEDVHDVPDNEAERRAYNIERNKWLNDHVERKYTKEYYDLFNNLSEEAKMLKEEIDIELTKHYAKATDKNGNIDKVKLSDADWIRVQFLLERKKNLSNMYTMDGVAKVGIEKKIAEEIKEMNRKLYENVSYKVNAAKFKEAYTKAKTMYGDKVDDKGNNLFKKWLNRNTRVVISQRFWDIVSQYIESNNDPEYVSLKERRNDLKKLYKDENGDINPTILPDNVRKEWIEIEKSMKAISQSFKNEASNNKELFKYAETVVDPNFDIELERASLRGDESRQKWIELNTVETKKGRVPASFWSKFVPKDKSFYERVPTSDFNEIDPSSPFLNKNFDASLGETMIPKRSLYDNSRKFNIVKNNKRLSKYRDTIIKTIEDSNKNIQFMVNANKYKLPQVEDRIMKIVGREKGLWNKFKRFLQLAISIRREDPNYLLDPQSTKRADGSDLKIVPTRYMKMLDNPNDITRDLTGATIAYFNMSANHHEMLSINPELNMIVDQMGRRKVSGGKKADIKGTESNVYKMALKTLDRHVYGLTTQRWEIKIPGTDISVSASKALRGVSSYVRTQTLAHNPFVILTSLFTNVSNINTEAIAGMYFDRSTLAQADREMWLNMLKAPSTIENVLHNNKVIGMMEYNQLVTENHKMFDELDRSRIARAINKNFWYGAHTAVDYESKGRIALAIYFNHKLVDGKFVNFSEFRALHKDWDSKKLKLEWKRVTTTLYDAYEMKDSNFVLKDEYKELIPTLLVDRIKNTISAVSSRIDGQLTDIDRASIHYNALTQFLVMFRNFMIQFIQTRFKGSHYNYSTGMEEEGFYRTFAKLIRQLFPFAKSLQMKELLNAYNTATDLEKASVRRITTELFVAFVVMSVLPNIFKAAGDDDPDDYALNALAYLSLRVALELRTPYKLDEMFAMIKSPTAATPFMDSIASLFSILFDDPSKEVTRGPYAGMTKFQRSVIKVSPLKTWIEASDPKSKRLYLENQIMK